MKFTSARKKEDHKTFENQINMKTNNHENLQQNDISSESEKDNEKSSSQKKLTW